jgi:deazaflavin-dependent oxidoreductase (nitroreductase family)
MPRDTVELEVAGRRTGQPRRVALVLTELEGDHYLVSLAGEAEWVRNARAAGLQVTLRRWRTQHVSLHEVPPDERAPILKAYLGKRATSKSPEYEAREFFGVPLDATLDDLAAISPHYPVFRIDPVA